VSVPAGHVRGGHAGAGRASGRGVQLGSACVVGGGVVGSARCGEGGVTIALVVDDTGVFEPADVHVAQRLSTLGGETDERVALAVALVVRALRGGSVCLDVASAEEEFEIAGLAAAVKASPLLTDPPILRLNGNLLYLDRYWLEEQQ